jgi:hypothetical protein
MTGCRGFQTPSSVSHLLGAVGGCSQPELRFQRRCVAYRLRNPIFCVHTTYPFIGSSCAPVSPHGRLKDMSEKTEAQIAAVEAVYRPLI